MGGFPSLVASLLLLSITYASPLNHKVLQGSSLGYLLLCNHMPPLGIIIVNNNGYVSKEPEMYLHAPLGNPPH